MVEGFFGDEKSRGSWRCCTVDRRSNLVVGEDNISSAF